MGIIGGGPGGLMTAYLLEKYANTLVEITILEASPRLGGKIQTRQFDEAGAKSHVSYEAGAAEFYDYSVHGYDPLKELIAELGLSVAPMGGSAVIMNERVLAGLDDVKAELGPEAHRALVSFHARARDAMLPGDFYHGDHPDGWLCAHDAAPFDRLLDGIGHTEARRYVETLIHSDLATEPRCTNVGYGLQNYLMNDRAYMDLYSIVGGNEQLPRELAARLSARTLLEHRVHDVSRTAEGGYRVRCEQGGKRQQLEFDFLIVALPHNHVAKVEFRGERLAEAVREHQGQYDFPAHYLRMTLLFQSPFWRSTLTGSYWMLDRFGGCCLYDESLRTPGDSHGVLGWLLGGDAALALSQLDDRNLLEEALASLPEFLQHGREQFMGGRVHRWLAAVNGCPGGRAPRPLDERHRPDAQGHPRLLFVGDYLYDSTLNGVYDSAEYVAGAIAAETASAPPSHTSRGQRILHGEQKVRL